MSRLFRNSRSGGASHDWIFNGTTTAFTLTAGAPETHTATETADGNANGGTMYSVVVLTQCRFKVGVSAVAGSTDAILPAGEYLIGVPLGARLSIVRDGINCTGTITACGDEGGEGSEEPPEPELLPLDLVSGAVAAYSLRKLRAGYTGKAVRVRRQLDDAELDIGFSGNDFDVAAYNAFVGLGFGYVTTWYDQVGNADAVQATHANQPNIQIGATPTGKPAVRATGSGENLVGPLAVPEAAPITLSAVTYSNGGNYMLFLDLQDGTTGNTGPGLYYSNANSLNIADLYGGSGSSIPLDLSGAFHSTIGILDGSTSSILVDGMFATDEAPINAGATSIYLIGDAGGLALNGYMAEGIYFNVALSDSDAYKLQANHRSYYINAGTRLLDIVPGATAGYSLRKLRSAYAGAAVRVRRSSDDAEQDIGFAGYDFDAAAFTAFVGAGTGFVTTWYDQVGDQDAIQETQANQPQLVIGVTPTGRPAVYNPGTNGIVLGATLTAAQTAELTLICVSKRTGNFGNYNIPIGLQGGEHGDNGPGLYYGNSADGGIGTSDMYAAVSAQGAATDADFHSVIGTWHAASFSDIWIDGVKTNGFATLTNVGATNLYITGDDLTSPLAGYVAEGIYFGLTASLSDEIIAILAADHVTYYGPAVPDVPEEPRPLPLDIIPDAAFAYSYRKLRSDYEGAAIQARRTSDSTLQNFGFQENGDWAIPDYHTFIGGGDAKMQKWYDQSGNSNDQVQTTAAKQYGIHAPDYPTNNVTGAITAGDSGVFMTAPDLASVQGIWDAGGFVAFVYEVNSAGSTGTLLSKGSGQGTGWFIFDYNNGGQHQLLLYWYGAPGGDCWTWASNPVSASPARHVVTIAWDKSTQATPAVITLDGVVCSLTNSIGGALVPEAGPLAVMNDKVDGGSDFVEALNGQLYEIMAWKSIPSAPDQAALVTNMKAYYIPE
jgi:hypothetical protein